MISRRRKVLAGVLGLLMLLVVVVLNTNSGPSYFQFAKFEKDSEILGEIECGTVACREILGEIEFGIVACRGNSGNEDTANNFQRQLRQISVLLKSAAALTSYALKFNIVSDSLIVYQEITNLTSSWPDDYKKRILFGEYKDVFYPPGTEKMKYMFRPCATERLFLPQAYENKDTLVFLDTDTLFLRPPEELLYHFSNFALQHVIGIAPCLYMYGPTFWKFPTYGSSGLNAGVLLMNLTRIRSFHGGWTEAILKIVEKYGEKLHLADQDILNILFSSKENAIQLYELGCEWNYREKLCSYRKNTCKCAEKTGVGLLHGAALTFVNGKEKKFQAVFEAWEHYQLQEPLSVFLGQLEATLKSQKKFRGCSRWKGVNSLLLRGLQDTLRDRVVERANIYTRNNSITISYS